MGTLNSFIAKLQDQTWDLISDPRRDSWRIGFCKWELVWFNLLRIRLNGSAAARLHHTMTWQTGSMATHSENLTLYGVRHHIVPSCYPSSFPLKIQLFQHQFTLYYITCPPNRTPLLPRNWMELNSHSKTHHVVPCCLERASGKRALIDTLPKAASLWLDCPPASALIFSTAVQTL